MLQNNIIECARLGILK
jgi:phosphoenolpyruvate carboxylase